MKKQSNMRQKMIAKIHIAKSELDLDDDVYRDLLTNATGKRSCAQMDDAELEKVLNALKQKGFAPDLGRMPPHLVQHRPMMNKIAVLLKQTHKTWSYADGMAREMFHKDKLIALDGQELHKLVSALQIYANRHTKGKHHA